jgi:DNA-binding NarL/FixJ family response regulator
VIEAAEKIRVVIMDDHADVVTLLRITAEMNGRFEVVGTASDGTEVIALAHRLRPNVIILDHLTDGESHGEDDTVGMSGRDAVDHMRDLLPGVFVVVYSGFARESDASDGADLYAVKGEVVPAVLMERIADAVPSRA